MSEQQERDYLQQNSTSIDSEKSTCVLTLLSISMQEAVLRTMSGQEAIIPLTFGKPVLVGRPLLRRESAVTVRNGGKMTVSDLGEDACELLQVATHPGLRRTVRVIHKGELLGMHRPLATLLDSSDEVEDYLQFSEALERCHYCRHYLHHVTPNEGYTCTGPYTVCQFCDDTPVWHHEWCCPGYSENEP